MSYLIKLKTAKDRKEFAKLLNYKPKSLTAIVYKTPALEKYAKFEISKKSGGVREIKAPNPRLKKLQQHLANYLYSCLEEIEAERKSSLVSHGFRKKTSISNHARKHKRKRYVMNIDIEDFFPSLNFGRVRGFFLKDKCFELNEQVATTLAQIACDEHGLPQGSPCSPVISELICQILDLRLLRFSKKHGVTYSRYADDITFSTNQKVFPKSFAYHDESNPNAWIIGTELSNKIVSSGFKINNKKTRVQVKGSRQEVTGLIVNQKVNIKSSYYRNARAMCDSLFQSGKYYRHSQKKDNKKIVFISKLYQLEGILNYTYQITQSEERRTVAEQREHPRAIRKLYRRFLFFKHCVVLDRPLIITEGKTDPIYLREAIRHRSKVFPSLGAIVDGNFKFAVKFFNYEGKSHEIMDLGGGSGDLKSIPLDYLRNFSDRLGKRKPIKFKPMKFPVILLLDNDAGLAPVASTMKTNFDVKFSKKSTLKFYHITENLYVVKTPEKTLDTCIEDLFPKKWLKVKLNGKSFNSNAKINPTTEYSKEIFAKRVVRPNSAKIDFVGFDTLLERIEAVVKDYSIKSQVKM